MSYVLKEKIRNRDLKQIPLQARLKNGISVTLDYYDEQKDYNQIKRIFYSALEEGISYPFDSDIPEDSFKTYYFSYDVFVLKSQLEVIGCFYIKPNFPDKCSHYCNGGFLVDEKHRRKGAGEIMGKMYLILAKELGYQQSFFNLVFTCNPASVNLWKKLNFIQQSILPQVFQMKNGQFSDAIQFRYDLQQDISHLLDFTQKYQEIS